MKRTVEQITDNPIVRRYYKRLSAYWKLALRAVRKYAKNPEIIMRRIQRSFSSSIVQISCAIFIIMLLSLFCVFFQVGNRFDNNLYIINIPRGYAANQVAELLESRGIIEGRYGFNLIVNMFRLQNRMQAGTYEFTPNMSLVSIVWKIKSGKIIPPMLVKLVIPEGLSIYKMGKFMEKEGVGDGIAFQELVSAAISPKLVQKYPFLNDIATDSLEGYLFPDTYFISSNISMWQMADLMLSRFNNVIISYWKRNYKRMKVKMSLHQVLTLASIIEKEAAVDSERPAISSVYHNRLRIRMHLGADPTIKYVLERPGKIVSYDDLKIISPYNTYRNYGLPPGPICSPGLPSVKAAMFPEKSDYLYFVARADGSHIFSKTLADHQIAQQQTRKERIRKIFRKSAY